VNLRSGASNLSNDFGLDCPQSETFHDARARRRTCSAVPPVATLNQIAILTIDMPSPNRVGTLPESSEPHRDGRQAGGHARLSHRSHFGAVSRIVPHRRVERTSLDIAEPKIGRPSVMNRDRVNLTDIDERPIL
jgi:hypothetical protein